MNGNDTSVNVSSLTRLLKSKLEATKRTKTSVSQSCNDTHDVLKKWFIPEDVKAVEPSKCTCVYPGIENDSNVQEIADGIGDVVNNAKTLRASFSARPYQSTSGSRLTSNATGLKGQIEKPQANRPSIPRSNSMKSNMVGVKHSQSIPSSTSTSSLGTADSNPSSLLTKRPSAVKSNTSRPTSSTRQSTYQRDFGRRPPLKPSARPTSGQVTSTVTKKQSPQNTAQNVDKKPEAGKISIAQLEALLSRVSIDATLYSKPIDSSGDVPPTEQPYYNENCLVHGTNAAGPLKQPGVAAMKQVGLAEAIDVVGVPSDLVKVLQSYHRFLDKYHGDTQENPTEPEAANAFLGQLTKMNESNWSEAMQEPVASLFSDYMPLYNKASKLNASGNKSAKSLSNLRDNLDVLETKFRKCSDYDSLCMPVLPARGRAAVDTDIKKKTAADQLAISGIWNDASLRSFRGMRDTLCIRYNTPQQVQLFLRTLHEIQVQHYQIQLLDVLANEIVPQLHTLDPNTATFRQLFKVCSALCDVFKLRVPVLLKKPRGKNTLK